MYVGTFLNHVGDIVIDPNSMATDESQSKILLITHLIENYHRVKPIHKHINQLTITESDDILNHVGGNVIKIGKASSNQLLKTLADE